MNEKILLILSIGLFIIFVADTVVSLNIMNRFKKTLSNIELKKDSTLEFKKMVSEKINEGHRIFQKRLLKAFPQIDVKPFMNFTREIKGLKGILRKK